MKRIYFFGSYKGVSCNNGFLSSFRYFFWRIRRLVLFIKRFGFRNNTGVIIGKYGC